MAASEAARARRDASSPWEVRDPISALPPTAQRILKAARSLLENEGFEALTLSKIAAAAGDHKASIGYYFGNKAGLLGALADYLIHDYTALGLAEGDTLPVGRKRARAVVRAHARMVSDTKVNRSFFEILILGNRDPQIRERMALAYGSYRDVNLEQLLGRDRDSAIGERARPLGALCLAVIDGLALQALLGATSSELQSAFQYWEEIVGRLSQRDWTP